MHIFSDYQRKQVEVIDKIERLVRDDKLTSTVVTPVDDFENDLRICLTSVHLPNKEFLKKVIQDLIEPLKKIAPKHYYYNENNLHITIKNIRIIHYPPNFDHEDIEKVKKVFDEVIAKYTEFKAYFYRLLFFPQNLALMGTSEEELDKINLDLDQKLSEIGLGDDKKYINSKNFFCNMTLARFNSSVDEEFKQKVEELSSSISFEPYLINNVSLISANAVLKDKKVIKTWDLKKS